MQLSDLLPSPFARYQARALKESMQPTRQPQTHLFVVRTPYASYPMLWMKFADERPFVLPQLWVASPPHARAPVPR